MHCVVIIYIVYRYAYAYVYLELGDHVYATCLNEYSNILFILHVRTGTFTKAYEIFGYPNTYETSG